MTYNMQPCPTGDRLHKASYLNLLRVIGFWRNTSQGLRHSTDVDNKGWQPANSGLHVCAIRFVKHANQMHILTGLEQCMKQTNQIHHVDKSRNKVLGKLAEF